MVNNQKESIGTTNRFVDLWYIDWHFRRDGLFSSVSKTWFFTLVSGNHFLCFLFYSFFFQRAVQNRGEYYTQDLVHTRVNTVPPHQWCVASDVSKSYFCKTTFYSANYQLFSSFWFHKSSDLCMASLVLWCSTPHQYLFNLHNHFLCFLLLL